MSQLNLQINGRAYSIACDDGQEEHLQKLAKYFGDRVEELAGTMGQIGDARLMLMTGLMVADELSDAYAEVEEIKAQMAELQKTANQSAETEKMAEILASMATRIESVAEKLESN